MNRILCSTGAVVGRPNGRDITLLRRCMDELSCDGYEFMMYETWYDKLGEVLGFMEHLGAAVPTLHVEKQVGELLGRGEEEQAEGLRRFEINCAAAGALGAGLLVLHLWNGMDSDHNIARNMACYPALREIADRHGLTLTIENVVCAVADPMTHMRALADAYPDVCFTFDTKMAAFHGQLTRLYSDGSAWLHGRIRHLHVNDYRGGYKDWANLRTLHIGQGHLDFGRLAEHLRRTGYAGDMTIEATSFDREGAIDFDALRGSIARLRGLIEQPSF